MLNNPKSNLKKWFPYFPLILIVLGMLALYLSGIYSEINFSVIKTQHQYWKHLVHEYPGLSALCFVLVYTLSVCLIIPDSTLLSIIGGLLFPLPLAILYIVVSETLGAMIFFWAIQSAFGHRKKTEKLKTLEEKIKKHQISYLLFFRFSHLLPFWTINFIGGYFNISTRTFFWTTLVGVLPLAFILAQGGSGLSHYMENHQSFSIAAIFNFQVKLALLGLSLLALFPIFLKRRS
jgi:uncharacterized membrane protein YdjX (TVP38/TMEM64 family)